MVKSHPYFMGILIVEFLMTTVQQGTETRPFPDVAKGEKKTTTLSSSVGMADDECSRYMNIPWKGLTPPMLREMLPLIRRVPGWPIKISPLSHFLVIWRSLVVCVPINLKLPSLINAPAPGSYLLCAGRVLRFIG